MNTYPTVRIVIADDHKLVRNALRTEISRESDMEVVGECATGDEVAPMIEATHADVVLLDLSMPGLSALQILRRLSVSQLKVRVLVSTASGDPETIRAFLDHGALGYFVKNDDPGDIALGIRSVMGGKTWLSATAATALAETEAESFDELFGQLSYREVQVLRQLATGATNAEIGLALSIAEGTVKNHISNLYQRLGLHTRAEAAAWVWKNDLLGRFAPLTPGT